MGDEQGLVAGVKMREALEAARCVADARVPVVLHGETGTGKEVLAWFIHQHSPRRDKRMTQVNCGAIPKELIESTFFGHERGAFTGAIQQQKGVFEDADGSTLFLDELGELPLAAQASLLRVLETGTFCRVGSSREIAVDVRLIAATHKHLESMVEAGTFRADLYYRLSTIVVEIPPLRERLDEIDLFARHFLELANKSNGRSVQGLAPEALALLRAYPWPGNVRELKNAIERAVVMARGTMICPGDLPERVRLFQAGSSREPSLGSGLMPAVTPPPIARGEGARERLQQYEVQLLSEALEGVGWNRTEAAKRLGIPVRTLAYRMKVLGLSKPGR
ncbi:sigma-54 interaction domain-containing protein [Archangium lipolyticum]|uniref:sigma-54 interaction domain-containing protein n=1 Tax=Archangium lipolyticum TaxID=2970465 RepID=UPI00214A176D|nr:sigma 54-interacting transcriptional regulator [Archangium lipolyticum]